MIQQGIKINLGRKLLGNAEPDWVFHRQGWQRTLIEGESGAGKSTQANTTDVYSSTSIFEKTLQCGTTSNSGNYEVVNYTTFEAVCSKLLDSEFADQQSWFTETVLPSQYAIESNRSAWAYCVADLNTCKKDFDFANNTQLQLYRDQLKEKDKSINYLIIGLVVLFIIMMIMVLNSTGAFDRMREAARRKTG